MSKKEKLVFSALQTAVINYEDRLSALNEEKESIRIPNVDTSDIDEQIKHYELCLSEAKQALQEVC